jgi:hypothetical protein
MAPPLTAWQLAGKAYFYVATWMSISMAVILFNKVRRVPREERRDLCRKDEDGHLSRRSRARSSLAPPRVPATRIPYRPPRRSPSSPSSRRVRRRRRRLRVPLDPRRRLTSPVARFSPTDRFQHLIASAFN